MLSDRAVLDLIGRIYDAAGDPDLWPEFLEAFADQVHGKNTILIQYDLRTMQGALVRGVRTDPEVVRRYNEYYRTKDVWALAAGARLRDDFICVAEEYYPTEELIATEFYNDFLAPQGVLHLCYANVKCDNDWSICLSTLRSPRQDAFGAPDLALLGALAPHLRRACQLHRRLALVENQRAAVGEMLDHLPFGVIFVDHTGRVLSANRAAVAILDQKDGLRVRQGVLTVASDSQRRELLRMIASAAATADGNGFDAGGALPVQRPSLNRPLSVLVAPLRGVSSVDGHDRASAVIFVNDPEKEHNTSEKVLARLLSLTGAEARLAALLMGGDSVDDAAEKLNVSRNTVRWQLQKIFEKSGTQRQGQLVRLLLSTFANFGQPAGGA